MYRVLLVDDDPHLQAANRAYLEREGYEILCAFNGEEALRLASTARLNAIVLDVDMPGPDGVTVCRRLREVSSVPILFLSSAADNMNQIMAMNMGGDDFIAKPFDYDVLIAKMQALLRRAYDFAGHMPVLECRGAFLHLEKNTLTYGDAVITLTKNEHRILSLLMENKDSIVSRERLMDALWESDCYVDDNTLSVNVNRLRKKLEDNGLSDFIGTKFGVGYYIREEKDDGKK